VVQWYNALRSSIYVSAFWSNIQSMLSMDLSAVPDVRESILGEVADFGRGSPLPPQIGEILDSYSDRPYLFSAQKNFVRLISYKMKQVILNADMEILVSKWLFFWMFNLAGASLAQKKNLRDIISMKDEIHAGLGYLLRPTSILMGRYGGFAVSFNLLVIKLEHLLVFRRKKSLTPFGASVFWVLRRLWRAKYIRRHVQSGSERKARQTAWTGQRGGTVGKLEFIDQPVYAATTKAIIVTRVQGGLGDIMMMRPGLLALAARKPSFRIFFATNRSFFSAFSVDDPITLIDIEATKIHLPSFWRWHNFSDCPASRVEVREFPKLKTNRIDIFARALGIRFSAFSRRRTRPFRFSEAHETRARELIELHRRPGTLFIAIQYRSAETYRDAPEILNIARELAKTHTVVILDHRPVPKEPGDGYIPITTEPLPVAMALITMADFMLGPDSSLFHVAGANRVPGLTLFGPTGGKVRTKAYPSVKYLDQRQSMACIPCWRNEFSTCKVSGDYVSICMKKLTAPMVLGEISPLLGKAARDHTGGALPSAGV
jgi:hypothetical protein